MRTALALFLICGTAAADMWGDWVARRETDPAGRYYVVLRYDKAAREARYTLASAGAEAPPADRVEYGGYAEFEGWSPDRGVREGDRVLATGGLQPPPCDVIVSATGLGFVALDEWWGEGYGSVVTCVRAGGSRCARRIDDLFGAEEIERFMRSSSSIHWRRGAWLDDTARKVVLVTVNGELRTVGWDDGAVGPGTDADVVRALGLPYGRARRLALELVAERRIGAAKEAARRLLADETELPVLRLRAAVALAAIGDRSGKEYLLGKADAARAADGDDVAEYAILHLPDVLGEEAIPRLVAAAKAGASEGAKGLGRLGAAGVPALLRLVVEEDDWTAARTLENLGVRRAVPVLIAAAGRVESKWAAKEMIEGALALSMGEIDPEIVDLLRRESAADIPAADYFARVKCPESVPVLVRALCGSNPDTREHFLKALRFQTGLDLGSLPAPWEDWLEKR